MRNQSNHHIPPEAGRENLFEGVYHVDLQQQITCWNHVAERISGYRATEVVGVAYADHLFRYRDEAARDLESPQDPLTRTLQDGIVRETNAYVSHKQGYRAPITVRIAPLRDEQAGMIGAVGVFTDNSDFRQLIQDLEQVRHEAYLDELTQVGNRRYTELILESRRHELTIGQIPFGVIALDLDHFAQFNTTNSRDIGDSVLSMIGETLLTILRRTDGIARWENDEFIVVIPNVAQDILQLVTERIRRLIEQSSLLFDTQAFAVTVSIGATFGSPDDTIESLIQRVHTLVAASKTAGGNCITIG